MYKSRFLIDEESRLYEALKNLSKEELIALNLKGVEGVRVVVSQEEYFELKAIEEEYLIAKGLRAQTRTPYDSEELKEKIRKKMEELGEKVASHNARKVQGISVIEGEDN